MIHTGNREHGERIMRVIGSDFSEVTMQVISRTENGVLYGGAVFENYTGPNGSIEAHLGALLPNWMNRDMLWVMFNYPFVQLDCRSAFVRVAGKNTHTLGLVLSMGFQKEFVMRDVFPDDDMVILRMSRDTCRFLNLKPRHISPKREIDNG